jgi:asparagine synthase (glutamine-hydrolysing)
MLDSAVSPPTSNWFVVLPDCRDAGEAVAPRLRGAETGELCHPSGRPWIIGRWSKETIAIGRAGRSAIVVLGQHAVTTETLDCACRRVQSVADVERVTRPLAGSYSVIASIDGHVRVQGTVTGTRRVFHAEIHGIPVASDRADVLAALLGTGVDEQRLAVRLLEPPILYPLTGQPVWRGVDLLPGSHYLTFDGAGQYRTTRWWSPPEPVLPMVEGAQALREALTAAVAVRSRGQDLVSCDLGGLDSTAVACLAAGGPAHVVAFTAASADPAADDVMWASRTVAQLPKVEHHVIPANEMPLVYHGLSTLDDPLDEPFAGAVDRDRWLTIVEHAAARGSRLHLTGFGGDELLYGSVAHLHEVLRSSPRTGWNYLRGFVAKYRWSRREALRQLMDGRSYDTWMAGVADSITERRPPSDEPLLGWGFNPRLPPWATSAAVEGVRDLIRRDAPRTEPWSPRRGHHRELATMHFVSGLARQLDQMAFPLGVSLANPYHDDHVVEAGLAVRPEERITPWRYKPLIVEAMRGIVPDASLARQTKANGTGDEEPGLRRHRGDLLALWEDSRLGRLGLIDAGQLREMCTRPIPPDLQLGVLYQSIACEVWLRSLERATTPVQGR